MSMITYLLLLTPNPDFGSRIVQSLDAKRFEAFITADFSEAIRYVRKTNCRVAVLDAALDDEHLSVLDIGDALRKVNKDLEFILITPEGQTPKSGNLAPFVSLIQPVSASGIAGLVEKAASAPTKTKGTHSVKSTHRVETSPLERDMAETANLMWLKDVSRAAQHLTQLTLESSAQAALITREDELWAYAGQLSREAAQELGRSLQRYWNKESESDLLRFVRLEATDAQHMLYARKLSASMILALVFDAETPFSTIRAQAGKLVRTLAEPHLDDLLSAKAVVSAQPTPQPTSVGLPQPQPQNVAPNPSVASAANLANEASSFEEEAIPNDLPPISELLGDVPPPNPVRQRPAPKTVLPWEQVQVAEAVPNPQPRPVAPIAAERPVEIETSTADMAETRLSSNLLAAETRVSPITVPSELQETRRQSLEVEEIQEDPQSYIETRAQNVTEPITQAAHRILLEPASPALVNLTYACLLIPRFDTHHLVGDTAERLTEWVPQLCIAFGWRLEHLSVRPEYLQWVVRVPPSTAPGYIMRIVRQQTSDRLFGEFARYKKENPSGDFWAPGYLIMGSSQPHPQKLVRDFVRQTRQRQGLEH